MMSYQFNQDKQVIFSCISSTVEKKAKSQLAKFYASYQLGYFSKNQGLTIANALRRTMLNQTRQFVISCIRIENVKHEYSSLPGIKETIFEILNNIQNVILSSSKNFSKTQIAILNQTGPKIIYAKYFQLPNFIFCLNPNQYITTIESNQQFKMIFFIENLNYYSSNNLQYYYKLYQNIRHSKKPSSDKKSDFLILKNNFSSVININYTIQTTIQLNEIIIFHICTDGSIHPGKLLRQSIQQLLITLIPFNRFKVKVAGLAKSNLPLIYKKLYLYKFLKLDLANLPISLKTYLKLRGLNVYNVGDLYNYTLKHETLKKTYARLNREQYKEIQILLKLIKRYLIHKLIKLPS
uniref:Plastid-encoded RNA polymerase subunit alpha n=1 Tax=Pedobesia claviformis TaxID=2364088 RepID=A0A386B0S1_9CHLO|nr:RNA polymerase a-subunit [Pedobesia claviformis]AYC65287.1 RNA polymerase a-subunit [Pedobesia claviformis]